jgi:hypothetical protein
LVCQQSLHKPKFLLWNRHGAANALTPQPFLVAPSFDREDRSFQEEHVNALVHEGAAELVGPSIGSALKLSHTPQGSVLAVRVVGSLGHILIVPQNPQFLQGSTHFGADR